MTTSARPATARPAAAAPATGRLAAAAPATGRLATGRPATPGRPATGIEVRAIDHEVAGQLRLADDAGAPPRLVTDDAGGSPLRCCLRRSAPGERIALVSYAPLRRWARETGADPGPYDEVGPVFICRERCAGWAGRGFPAELAGSPRMLRAYAADGRILYGRLMAADETSDETAVIRVMREVLADPRAALVHARAVEFGCFTFEVRRH